MNLGNEKSIFKPVESVTPFTSVGALPATYTGVARVGTDLYVGDGVSLSKGTSSIYLSASNTASQNTAAIQAALDAAETLGTTTERQQIVNIAGTGTVLISSAIIIPSWVILKLDKSLEIKASGAFGTIVKSKSINTMAATPLTVSSITWSHTVNYGKTAIINITGHTLTAKDKLWLKGADAAIGVSEFPFNGVFDIASIVAGVSVTIYLKRVPSTTTAPSGVYTAIKAQVNCGIIGGLWNFNYSGGNVVTSPNVLGGAGVTLAIRFEGCYNLILNDIAGKDTPSYLIQLGAINTLFANNITGVELLRSDTFKVFGPAFDINVNNINGASTDDTFSIQPRCPDLFIAYRSTFGDIIGCTIQNIKAKSTTALLKIYSCSSGGLVDNVTFSDCNRVDVEVLLGIECEDGGKGLVGTVLIQNSVGGIQLGSAVDAITGVSSSLEVKSLSINGHTLHSINNTGTLLSIASSGNSLINANIIINGGYLTGIDKIVNTGSTGNINVTLNSTTVDTCYRAFQMYTVSGITEISLNNVKFNANPSSHFLYFDLSSGTTGTPSFTFNIDSISIPSTPVIFKGTTPKLYSLNKGFTTALSNLSRDKAGQMVTAAANTGTGGVTDILANNVCINDATNTTGSWKQLSAPTTRVY